MIEADVRQRIANLRNEATAHYNETVKVLGWAALGGLTTGLTSGGFRIFSGITTALVTGLSATSYIDGHRTNTHADRMEEVLTAHQLAQPSDAPPPVLFDQDEPQPA